MAKRWSEVLASPNYQSLSAPDKAAAQAQYFNDVVKPQLSPEDVEAAHTQFYNQYPVGQQNQPQKMEQSTPAPAAPQEAEPQQAPTNTDNPYENAFNYVGNIAASGGRMIAGGVADLANVGVGAANAVQSAGAWAGKQLGLGDGTYTPIAPAGYGELDKYLMPRGTGEKAVAAIVPYVAGGEIAAPIKAAEGAGRVSRLATTLANQVPASFTGALSENNQGNASDIATETAINSLMGGAIEKVAAPVVKGVRSLLPEGLGGLSQAEKAATVANPDYVNRVLQNGDTEAQQAFRTATTDETGQSILNPSQTLNAQAGKKFIAAEQRDLTRGANSQYAPNLEAQQSGEGITRAVNDLSPEGQTSLQEAAQGTTQAFKDRAKELYTNSKQGAQDILDSAPVKITELKFPDTKTIAATHLEDNAATGNIKLTGETRRTLSQFNKAKIDNIDSLDMWKRQLNEKAQKAYRGGDMTSYNALKDVSNSLKNEADSVINAINPQAGSLYKDADSFYSASVGDFGDKSVLGKLANNPNPDTAPNVLLRGQNAQFNTNEVMSALQDAINRGDIPNAQALSDQLKAGLGTATRNDALNAASTGENFSNTKFINSLNRTAPQAEAAGAGQVNNALADSIRTIRDRQAVPVTNNLIAQAAGRATGGTIGAIVGGGPVGGLVGQEVGGRVTSAIQQGLLDRLAGTTKRGNEYVQYLSDPANAQKVSDILASRGANFDTASAKEVAGIIRNLTTPAISNALESEPAQAQDNPLPTLPEQHAQAARVEPEPEPAPTMPNKYDDAIRFYKSIASAETGGLDNRFIRTKASEGAPSTAYGPAQITVTLADDFRSKHPDLFTKSEKEYLDRFSAQGHKMLKADPSDPIYGYGGTGDLTSAQDQKLYARVAVKMLNKLREQNNGSYDKTLEAWRGNNKDKAYFAKVRNAMQQTKRSGWGVGLGKKLFKDE